MKFSFFKSILAVILNKNSEEAFDQVLTLELYQKLLIASLVRPFSIRGEGIWKEVAQLLPKVEAALVAQMAVYFRDHFPWPWVIHRLLVKWSGLHQGDGWVKRTTEQVLRQPEDIVHLLACYQTENEGLQPLSKQLQKGIAVAFKNLTLEQLVGFHRHRSVSLRDALLLTHPKAQNPQQERIFRAIHEGQLPLPPRWKREWRTTRRTPGTAAQHWSRWIRHEQLPYADLLRHLRAIIKAGPSDETMESIQQQLTDARAIHAAHRLPFFFFSERKKIEKLGSQSEALRISEWLTLAQARSATNLRGFSDGDRLLVAVDRSPHLSRPVGKKNPLRYADIGRLLVEGLQDRVAQLQTRTLGGGTEGTTIDGTAAPNPATLIDTLMAQKQVFDKVLIFTSGLEWGDARAQLALADSWRKYRQRVAPTARLYRFNLLDYDQYPVRILADGRVMIAGWSERIFRVLAELDTLREAVEKIKAIKINS